jgi:F-type H+-transporting ATPase subunit b
MGVIHALALQENVLKPDATVVVVFLTTWILVWVLDRLLFRPVNQILDERERRTRGYRAEAKAMEAESARERAQYEEAVKRARAEGYQLVEARRREALERREHLLRTVREEARERIERARRELAEQAQEARGYLEREAEELAREMVQQVLGRRVEEVTRIPS